MENQRGSSIQTDSHLRLPPILTMVLILGSPSEREQSQQDVDDPPTTRREIMSLPKTRELFSTLHSLQTLVTESKKEIRFMKQSVTNKSSDDFAELSGELEKLKLKNLILESRCAELSITDPDKGNRLEEEFKRAKDGKKMYKKKYNEMALRYKKEHDNVEELKKEVNKKKEEIKIVYTKYKSVHTQLTKLRTLYEKTEEEKIHFEDELSGCNKSRLVDSTLASNNPDLSDKNRATKLAEKSQALFENPWNDAYEAVEERFRNGKKSIQVLFQVLKVTKTQCHKLAFDQEISLHETVTFKRTKEMNLPDHLSKQIKDFRQSVAEACLPEVQEKDERVQSFFKECVELCWLMSVHDPPLVFGDAPESMDVFDTNTYKSYTDSGQYIDYIVWPALYLYKDGPLLGKGIAQAYGKEQKMSAKRRAGETPLRK